MIIMMTVMTFNVQSIVKFYMIVHVLNPANLSGDTSLRKNAINVIKAKKTWVGVW